MFDTLAAVHADLAERLTAAARDRRSPMHAPVVGCAGAQLRVMVLRGFDPATWTLRFHTDARSPKVAAIAADPAVGVLFYDAAAKIQLRCQGAGRVEREGPVADAAWAASSAFARRCYLAVHPPGAALAVAGSNLPPEMEGVQPLEEQLLPARENFAVLLVEVHEVDWLYLANSGHRRARLTQGGEGNWIAP